MLTPEKLFDSLELNPFARARFVQAIKDRDAEHKKSAQVAQAWEAMKTMTQLEAAIEERLENAVREALERHECES